MMNNIDKAELLKLVRRYGQEVSNLTLNATNGVYAEADKEEEYVQRAGMYAKRSAETFAKIQVLIEKV